VGIAALIGTVKSGAIAVPVTTSTPPARREQVFDDAEPVCIVTDRRRCEDAKDLARGRAAVLVVDDLMPAPARDWPRLTDDDPTFILYTSGSTGHPKGVVLTHRSVLGQVDATARLLEIAPGDRAIMISTFAVGQGFAAMFVPLLYGATACPFDVRRLGFERLVRFLVDDRISIYLSSATLFRSLVRTIGGVRCPALRFVRLNSERITVADVETFRKLFPTGVRLAIAYSSTETSTISLHLVASDETFPADVVPVGAPIPGVRVSILDDHGRALPPGEEGEIAAQGAALPLGYWRDPERTARTYRPSSDIPGERICKTGDLGRIRLDGVLEHLGRKDRRVKIRGFRVELEEVEAVLARHPSVSRAAVLAHHDQSGDATLVAYLQLDSNAPSSIEDIRRFVVEHLPETIAPTAFISLEALPLTDAGKVDLQALSELRGERYAVDATHEAPRTDTERLVAETWKEVLGLDVVGRHEPFLMVGGDSLRAGQVASRVSAAAGVEVQLWELLDRSTVSELASLVDEKTAKKEVR
jgi:amino acid adenylation domain-containing protein